MATSLLDAAREYLPGMEEKWDSRPKVKEGPVNTSGLEATGRAVLIKPYEVELKAGGLIELPAQVRGTMSVLEQRAVVIHIGESAWHDEPHPRAKVGDHVIVTRYAGFVAGEGMTADGQEYRFVTDRDIFARILKKGD